MNGPAVEKGAAAAAVGTHFPSASAADNQDNSSTGSEDVSKSSSSGSGPSHPGSVPPCLDATDDTTDTEASSGSMRHSLSDSAPPSVEAFPSLKDAVLRQLGLLASTSTCDVLPEQDVENKFIAMSLAMKTDKQTLQSRMERQERQRDQAERTVVREAANLQGALHKLNYLCKDSESIEILTNIKSEASSLLKAVERISSSSESLGAVRQECRVSKAFDVVLAHAERLKRMYEKEHSELEETKKVLSENNLPSREVREEPQGSIVRYRAIQSLSTSGIKMGSKRRASIAAMTRPTGSTTSLDSSRSSLSSYVECSSRPVSGLRFSSFSRRPSLAPSTSSSPGDPFTPTWDSIDPSDLSESFSGGAMDDITEVGEARPDTELGQEEKTNQRKMSAESTVDRSLSQQEVESVENLEEIHFSPLVEVNNRAEDCDPLRRLSLQFGPAVQTLREWWCGTLHDTMEHLWPLDAAQAVRMLRKFVVGLLLLAAAFSVASIVVPVGGAWLHEETITPLEGIQFLKPPS